MDLEGCRGTRYSRSSGSSGTSGTSALQLPAQVGSFWVKHHRPQLKASALHAARRPKEAWRTRPSTGTPTLCSRSCRLQETTSSATWTTAPTCWVRSCSHSFYGNISRFVEFSEPSRLCCWTGPSPQTSFLVGAVRTPPVFVMSPRCSVLEV